MSRGSDRTRIHYSVLEMGEIHLHKLLFELTYVRGICVIQIPVGVRTFLVLCCTRDQVRFNILAIHSRMFLSLSTICIIQTPVGVRTHHVLSYIGDLVRFDRKVCPHLSTSWPRTLPPVLALCLGVHHLELWVQSLEMTRDWPYTCIDKVIVL